VDCNLLRMFIVKKYIKKFFKFFLKLNFMDFYKILVHHIYIKLLEKVYKGQKYIWKQRGNLYVYI